MIARFRYKSVRFSYERNLRLICARELGGMRYFISPARGFWLYRGGLKNRGKFLFDSYCLQNINFSKNDVVIDCGANSADLLIKLESVAPQIEYIAIEPNPADFSLVERHLTNKATALNIALGNQNGFLDFYTNSAQGDSSVIEPEKYDKILKVEVKRLDTLLDDLKINRVKLLKLEAEGFEPEILLGIGERLSQFDYIAVDGGYERGITCEQTFTTVTNFLLQNNFEIIDIYFPWYRGLFRRKYEN